MNGRSVPAGCDLAVVCEHTSEHLILHVSGELDLATAPLLEDHLESAWAGDAPAVVLDLHELAFIDSTGVRLILRAQQRADAEERGFALRRLPDQARRVCDLVGLTGRVQMDD